MEFLAGLVNGLMRFVFLAARVVSRDGGPILHSESAVRQINCLLALLASCALRYRPEMHSRM